MGIYFNPDNQSFKKDTNNEIYIDKTGLLNVLNQLIGGTNNCIALSHARRFGKSQVAGMIDAYYSLGSDSEELFSRFEIAQSPDFYVHLNKYNVIHIDASSFTDNYDGNVNSRIWGTVYREMCDSIGELLAIGEPVSSIMMDAFIKTQRQFVIVIDEWDCVVRNYSHKPEVVHEYLQFLHSLFKSEESKRYLALAYITGILPVKKIKDESALNNFTEYTMISSKKLTRYFGFTEDEVKNLCSEYAMEYETIKQWYDGYTIDGMHMYNPNSVCRAMMEQSFEPYWRNTSSFETINDFISMNFEGQKEDILKMLEGDRVSVDINSFQNDFSLINSKDDALTALIHMGYLGYDVERKKAYVPNFEVATAFQSALSDRRWGKISKTISTCDELLWATIDGKADKVAQLVEAAHETYTSVLEYNDENSLSCVLTMAYFTAPAYYNVIREFPSGKGFADLVFIPRADSGNKPTMIIELKYDKDAKSAINQIKDKNYAGNLIGYSSEILLVGINYDKTSKKHECVIETVPCL